MSVEPGGIVTKMNLEQIDSIRLNFTPESLTALNVVIAIIMFGVALDIRFEDFKDVLKNPRPPLIGLSCQFFLLPALVFALTMVLKPLPSVALGLILIAACPGGNFSNFLTHFSGGNAALSVSMSSISTILSIVMTPFNIAFWGGLNPHTADLLRTIQISPLDVLKTVMMILIIPLVLGMGFGHRFPALSQKLEKGFKYLSVAFLIIFIVIALVKNYEYFIQFVGIAVVIVFLANSLALIGGYFMARLTGLSESNARAVSFEVGIQNSGFGLILVFNFFNGLGGMAIIAAWWGVWHIVSGLALATFWSRRPVTDGIVPGNLQEV